MTVLEAFKEFKDDKMDNLIYSCGTASTDAYEQDFNIHEFIEWCDMKDYRIIKEDN